jgi:hypothetical protein
MKILADGDSRYRLTGDDGREAGWIRGARSAFWDPRPPIT